MNATYGWLARRRMGAAEAIEALTEARRAAAKEPGPKDADGTNQWTKALTAVVAAFVLAGTGVIAVVVVGTQIGFYRELMRVKVVDFSPLPFAVDLPVFTPFATEGVVWMCTLMAVVLVILNRPSGLWTQAMWLFAGIQAFVNSFHAIHTNDDLLGGIVTGGLSISGPFVVHLFVIWVQHLRSGRTLTEARVETSIRWAAIARVATSCALLLLDHTVHPVTAARTISVWRAYRGITYSQAWFVASKPLRAKTRARLAAHPEPTVRTPLDAPVQDAAPDLPAHPVRDEAHGGVLTAVRTDDRSDEQEMLDSFLSELDDDARIEDALDALTKRTLSTGSTSENDDARTVNAHPHARPSARGKSTPSAPVRTPLKKRGRTGRMKRNARTENTVPARDLIADEYYRRKHAREPVEGDGVNLSDLARQFRTSRTTVSKTFSECAKGTRPDPNPNRK